MSFHYLIDGYNVLYALSDFPAGTWEAKRGALLKQIARQAPHGKNRITVVFDSREGPGSRSRSGEIQVAFTSGETADDWISQHVRQAANPRALVVVTNDQGLRRLVRGTGARWIGVQEFWKQGQSTAKARPFSGPEIDSESITNEMKRKWLI